MNTRAVLHSLRPTFSVGRIVRLRHVRRAVMQCDTPGHVLDAGCGDGRLAAWIARVHSGSQVLGIDEDERVLEAGAPIAASLPNLTLRRGTIGDEAIPLTFDLILCTDVMEHIADDRSAMNWLASHLAPGGSLIMHVPFSPQHHLLSAVREHLEKEYRGGQGPHFREGYSRASLRSLANASHLGVHSIGHTFHNPLTRAAVDLDQWTFYTHRRWVKLLLLPALMLASQLERAPHRTREGHGLLLQAGPTSMVSGPVQSA